MNAEGGRYLKRHNHKKADILRAWSIKVNVTALKFSSKTNYFSDIWVYIIVLSHFFFCIIDLVITLHRFQNCALMNLRQNPLLILFGASWEDQNDSTDLKSWIILRYMVSTGNELLLSYDLSLLAINLCFSFDQLFLLGMLLCMHRCVFIVCKIGKSSGFTWSRLRLQGASSAKKEKLCEQNC
jgi:hypothetical protein